MAITDWPVADRPREKLLASGANHLTDTELLAIFLRTGTPGKSAVDLSRDVLQHFGGLRHLLDAEKRDFCAVPGLGEAKFAQLQAVTELTRRYLKETLSRETALTSPDLTRDYLRSQLRHYPYEVFATLFLDNQHRVISFEKLFRGTINSASVYPREVIRQIMKYNAAAVIFVHNHPSGVAEPSLTDRELTDTLVKALKLLDVRVLDHFVVGDDEVVSFAERGWI
ncbi:RadC family protein [Hahella ganghwensis]|uniref:RadC family protein n=1 Tax=Hahella ganghwensis TaxID=286420 RepID=UPI000369626B|nr:DNA repair protein RadC [Hahella ganghwensis]